MASPVWFGEPHRVHDLGTPSGAEDRVAPDAGHHLVGIAEGWRRNVEAAQRIATPKATPSAPLVLLGVYAKHCPFGHVIPASDAACVICATFADFEIEDRRAKDLEAGRVGEDPDYEGDEP